MNDEGPRSSVDKRLARRVADISKAAGDSAKVTIDRKPNGEVRVFITYKNPDVVQNDR